MLKRTTPAFRRGLLRRRLRIETNCQLFSYLTGVTGILSFRRNVTWPQSPSSFYILATHKRKGKCFERRERERRGGGTVFPSDGFYISTVDNDHHPGSVKFTQDLYLVDRRRQLPGRRTITVLEIFITAGQLMRVGECPRNYRRRGVKLIPPGSYI